jgi:hypothetical protein
MTTFVIEENIEILFYFLLFFLHKIIKHLSFATLRKKSINYEHLIIFNQKVLKMIKLPKVKWQNFCTKVTGV